MLGYAEEGFLAIQRAVDESIVTELNPNADMGELSVQLEQFPYPAYTIDILFRGLIVIVPAMICFCFCPAVMCLSEDVAKDKETMLKVNKNIHIKTVSVYFAFLFFLFHYIFYERWDFES